MSKFKLQNISEITEGRELLERKPNNFSLWFVYILMAILISFLLWAWFSTKEVVVSVPGIVMPSDKVYNVSSMMSGGIKNINVKNGEHVSKGQTLFTLNIKSANEQLTNLKAQESTLENNISSLNKLVKSISDDTNYLGNENSYYAQFASYTAQNNVINTEINSFNTQKSKVQNQINNLESLQKSINDNMSYVSGNTLYSSQYQNYANTRKSLESKLSELNTQYKNIQGQQSKQEGLQNSLSSSMSNVESQSSTQNYNATLKSLENKLSGFKSQYKNIENQQKKLEALQKTLTSNMKEVEANENKEKQSIKNNSTNNIANTQQKIQNAQEIASYQNQLNSIQTEIDNVQIQINATKQGNKIANEKNALTGTQQSLQNSKEMASYQNQLNSIQSEITSTNAQISNLPNSYLTQVNEQIQTLNNQLSSLDATSAKNKGSKLLTKWQLISQVNQSITSYKEKEQELKANIKQLSSQIKYGSIIANTSGTIYIPQTPQIGMVIHDGQTLAEIMPNGDSFKIKLIIPNDEIGNIKVKDEVKYSFLSFPYNEYGFLKGNLESINVTSELNPKTGLSYYSATSTLSTNIISNKEGKTGTIKLGMACTAKIISRKERMLYYILNQLGLKTNNI